MVEACASCLILPVGLRPSHEPPKLKHTSRPPLGVLTALAHTYSLALNRFLVLSSLLEGKRISLFKSEIHAA